MNVIIKISKVITSEFQLFSRRVGVAMRSYHESGHALFEGSLDTEVFTLRINDLFDCLNSRLPEEGFRLDSPQMTVNIRITESSSFMQFFSILLILFNKSMRKK